MKHLNNLHSLKPGCFSIIVLVVYSVRHLSSGGLELRADVKAPILGYGKLLELWAHRA